MVWSKSARKAAALAAVSGMLFIGSEAFAQGGGSGGGLPGGLPGGRGGGTASATTGKIAKRIEDESQRLQASDPAKSATLATMGADLRKLEGYYLKDASDAMKAAQRLIATHQTRTHGDTKRFLLGEAHHDGQ